MHNLTKGVEGIQHKITEHNTNIQVKLYYIPFLINLSSFLYDTGVFGKKLGTPGSKPEVSLSGEKRVLLGIFALCFHLFSM